MRLNDLFNRLESQENAIAGTTVLAPVLAGRAVCARIAGVVCRLKVQFNKEALPGQWGILQVLDTQRARWQRAATRGEIERYMALMPQVGFVVLERQGREIIGFPAHAGDNRFQLMGAAPVQCSAETAVQRFDSIIARFDGTHFWFDCINPRRSPAIAEYLRHSLADGFIPEMLRKKGLTAEERAAYAFALYGPPPPGLETEAPEVPVPMDLRAYSNPEHARLARALAHSGGQLVSYVERGQVYTVTYRFGDRTHTSTVRANDLSVVTSGICLSGRDGDFDLTSLVGVMQVASHEQPWQFGDDDD
jgi:hypothetical protein